MTDLRSDGVIFRRWCRGELTLVVRYIYRTNEEKIDRLKCQLIRNNID